MPGIDFQDIMYRATPQDGIALVTGASSGIGRATALELARGGYRVAVTARRAGELKQLAATAPEQIFAYPADVTRRAEMAAVIGAIEAEVGPIALAFLNAGVFLTAERQGFDAAVIAETHAVNVGGTVNCLAPLLAAMTRRGRGQIAVNASLAAYNGLPGSLAYGSSKAALIYMAEALKLDCEGRGVSIQVVCHGFVRTPMTSVNEFSMPFVLEADEAARRIVKALRRRKKVFDFPWQTTLLMKMTRWLPDWLMARGMKGYNENPPPPAPGM